jgi:uncharacterized protein (DUF305 family)
MNIFKKNTVSFILILALVLAGCSNNGAQPSSQLQTQSTQTIDPSQHQMHQVPLRTEQDFILHMIPHHQEAIDSSKILLEKTSDADLKKFATDVITVQTQEVVQMKQWLKNWYGQEYTTNEDYMPMMGEFSTGINSEVEKKYITGMIVHHQGAVDMAKTVMQLQPTPRKEIQAMSEDIISVQTKEMEQLQSWLQTKYPEATQASEVQHSMQSH